MATAECAATNAASEGEERVENPEPSPSTASPLLANTREPEPADYTHFYVFTTVLHLMLYLADLITDSMFAYSLYTRHEPGGWYFGLSIALILVPSATMSLVISRAYLFHPNAKDHPATYFWQRAFRVVCLVLCVLSPLPCFVDIVVTGLRYKSEIRRDDTEMSAERRERWAAAKKRYALFLSDSIATAVRLRLVYGFLGNAPQLLLMLYVEAREDHTAERVFAKLLSLSVEIAGLAWAVTSTRWLAGVNARNEPIRLATAATFISQCFFISARGLTFWMFASIAPSVVLPLMVYHFAGMFVWLRLVTTDCQHPLVFSAVLVFTYVPYINKFPVNIYFVVCYVENIIMMAAYWLVTKGDEHPCVISLVVVAYVHFAFLVGIALNAIAAKLEAKRNNAVEQGDAVEQRNRCSRFLEWVESSFYSCVVPIENNQESSECSQGCAAKFSNCVSCLKTRCCGRINMAPPAPQPDQLSADSELNKVALGWGNVYRPLIRILTYLPLYFGVAYSAYGYYSTENLWYFVFTLISRLGSEAIITISNVNKYVALRDYLVEKQLPPTPKLWWAIRICCLVLCISPLAWSIELIWGAVWYKLTLCQCTKLYGKVKPKYAAMLAIHCQGDAELSAELLRDAFHVVLTIYVLLTNDYHSVYGFSAWFTLTEEEPLKNAASAYKWFVIVMASLRLVFTAVLWDFPEKITLPTASWASWENFKRVLAWMLVYVARLFTIGARVIAIAAFASVVKWVIWLVALAHFIGMFIWLRTRLRTFKPWFKRPLLFAAVSIITYLHDTSMPDAFWYFVVCLVENVLMMLCFFCSSQLPQGIRICLSVSHLVLFIIGILLLGLFNKFVRPEPDSLSANSIIDSHTYDRRVGLYFFKGTPVSNAEEIGLSVLTGNGSHSLVTDPSQEPVDRSDAASCENEGMRVAEPANEAV